MPIDLPLIQKSILPACKPWIFFLFIFCSCKKLISIPPPVSSLTSQQVFSTGEEAQAAISGVYSQLMNNEGSFAGYGATVFCGLSADELMTEPTGNDGWVQFAENRLDPDNNGFLNTQFWKKPYLAIYAANAVIEGLENNQNVADAKKNQLIGEARFIRAFSNFYLVNLFGPVPLVTTVNWRNTNLLSRAPVDNVYTQIIADLKDAGHLLPADFSIEKGQRIRPTQMAAAALLARVHLYNGNWQLAEVTATQVISNPLFELVPLDNVFKMNNSEAIWQLQQNNSLAPTYNVTPVGYQLIPRTKNSNSLPAAWLTKSLLHSFENGDGRMNKWVDSTRYTIDNGIYYFASKYKNGRGQASANGTYSEYNTVLRLGEIYLVRAEARLNQQNLAGAIEDLNKIRERAGLKALSGSIDADSIRQNLIRERQIEFFAEWGHRWMDLKRWKMTDVILPNIKGQLWKSHAVLFPLPLNELIVNPNLVQNEGY